MANFLAWSFSRLHQFLECPKALWHNSVAPKGHPDRIPYEQNKFQIAGEEVDTALTARIGQNQPLPVQYQHLEPIASVLASAPGAKLTQLDIGLTQTFQPCSTRDWDNCWVRIKIDFAAINGPHAWFVDYKNGKVSPDEKQLKLYAIGGFHTYPETQVIDTDYAWLAHGKTTPRTYYRKDLEELWIEFLPDVERMQVSFRNNHWPATPEKRTPWGGSVCSYCNANKAGKCSVAAVKYGQRL